MLWHGAAWPRQRSWGGQQISAQKHLAEGASLPFPGSPGTVSVAAASPPPLHPSACPFASEGAGGSVGLGSTPGIWHVCAGRGSLSPNGLVLISSHGKEESSVACGDTISPGTERCSWATFSSQLRETGARSWGTAQIPSVLVFAHDGAGSSFPRDVCGRRGTGNTS